MPLYLTKFSYTPETWARLIDNPEDRRKAAQEYIESVGGTLHGFWYAFGAHDGYNLWEAPDNVSMAAVDCDNRPYDSRCENRTFDMPYSGGALTDLRPDEKAVTERAYANPVFVEDLVRNVAIRSEKEPDITWFRVEAENFESIHNHNAYAVIERKKGA